MIDYLRQTSGQFVKKCLIGVCVLVLSVGTLLGSAFPALAATEGSLSATMDLKLGKAAQEFVTSILEDYEDALEDRFNVTLKPLKSVTKDLTKQLSKLAVSPTPDATTLAPTIAASQTALETATTAFKALVDDTTAFKTTLATSPALLKDTLDAQLGTQFEDLQGALDGVAKALAALRQDTAAVDGDAAAAAVGKLTEDSTTLAQAIEVAKAAVSGFKE